jgi:hypothetical protein
MDAYPDHYDTVLETKEYQYVSIDNLIILKYKLIIQIVTTRNDQNHMTTSRAAYAINIFYDPPYD